MRKPLTIFVTLLGLGLLIYVSARVVLDNDGPCAPKQPEPTERGPSR
jgi:hypothetical protein